MVRCELVGALARAAGTQGMVGGQMLDMEAGNEEPSIGAVTRLQRLKTGELIAFSCEAGAILGHAAETPRRALKAYAHDLGLAFQIADDLIDAEGDAATAGKPTRRDSAAGKATFVSLLGAERAREQARMLAGQAIAHLDLFEEKADPLRAVALFVVDRRT
jgi:farnesyl diphosphate synthase